MSELLKLGVALEGAGWHPAAWREPSAQPQELFTGDYWVDRARDAESALADFVTIEDSLALQSSERLDADARTDEVRGRLDALLIASRVAPETSSVGLIPTVTTTHTEPFHVSTGLATLDYVSEGRGGWQPKVSVRADEAQHFGRRTVPDLAAGLEPPVVQEFVAEVFAEADDAVEVVRRLWDSWEDDAEIRDAATDRFLDRNKVHRIDFTGARFSVRGPAITPRPPQAQPVVAALAHAELPYRFAARSADLVFVTPQDHAHAGAIIASVADAEQAVGRAGQPLQVFADLVVVLDGASESGTDRLNRLDRAGRALESDARVFAGSAGELADIVAALGALGYAGVRLRPAVLTDDVPRIGDTLVPELIRRGLFEDRTRHTTLRARLGLATSVPNRYAGVAKPEQAGATR
ncbi:MAG: LLM class flavin-dependent oxidoreductase [Microbacterium sp.]